RAARRRGRGWSRRRPARTSPARVGCPPAHGAAPPPSNTPAGPPWRRGSSTLLPIPAPRGVLPAPRHFGAGTVKSTTFVSPACTATCSTLVHSGPYAYDAILPFVTIGVSDMPSCQATRSYSPSGTSERTNSPGFLPPAPVVDVTS